MKYKYEFEADEGFQKGCCNNCPFGYVDYDIDYDYNVCCVLCATYDECPLEEVKE